MFTIRPQRFARRCGIAALMRVSALIRVVSTPRRTSLSVTSSNDPGVGPPELVTRMSSFPRASAASFTNCVHSASLERSTTDARTVALGTSARMRRAASVTRAWSREQITTDAPSRASSSAQAYPSPWLEAATMADRPLIPSSMIPPLFPVGAPPGRPDGRADGQEPDE